MNVRENSCFGGRLCAYVSLFLLSSAGASAAPTVGPVNALPSSIISGVRTPVTVTAKITGATPISGGVNLLQEDGSGNTLGILGVMHDDGLNGDAVAGDGIFTLVVPFNPALQTTAIYLQVSAAFAGLLERVKSSVFTLPVTDPFYNHFYVSQFSNLPRARYRHH